MKTISTDLLVIGGEDIRELLKDKEQEVLTVIQKTYEAHAEGKTEVPFSTFLRFPRLPRDRIIGLPAFVDDERPIAGMKWVSSFPENLEQGIERASAIIALNDMQTGRPYAVLEGSLVNAARTAASAALAAKLLQTKHTNELVLIGCGPINEAIARFVIHALPHIQQITLYDVDILRARLSAERLEKMLQIKVTVAPDMVIATRDKMLISIATNAATPYIKNSCFANGSTILHISLRDIATNIILDSINVVDDIAHVNRESTSIHLTSQEVHNTDFIFGTIGEISLGKKRKPLTDRPLIYSPFGLGILDIKLGQFLYERALQEKRGSFVKNFFLSPGKNT